jgi:hypothetical protein
MVDKLMLSWSNSSYGRGEGSGGTHRPPPPGFLEKIGTEFLNTVFCTRTS